MNVWQVVGYKNSGKTTLIEKWIRRAASEGYQVGTIKHHGHGGHPDVADESTDSARHRQAGALAAAVEGGGLLQLHAWQNEWALSHILQLYSLLSLDFVIVEGYKRESYPKIVIVRDSSDWQELRRLDHIIGVIAWKPVTLPVDAPYPFFLLEDEERYLQWMMNEVKKAV